MNPFYTCRYDFPDPEQADPSGTGLIAHGADLAPNTLIAAYSQGLFPWFDEDAPTAWWSPDPRCILQPQNYKPSKSLKRQAKKSQWHWSVNHAFEDVIHACSLPRNYSDETWIHDEMISAYTQLHKLGFAHSIEVWQDNELIGGLYGLKIGQLYCGESMFHTESNASKLAFWALTHHCIHTKVKLIDCQLVNEHLLSLGADVIPRQAFLTQLPSLVNVQSLNWHDDSLYSHKSQNQPRPPTPKRHLIQHLVATV